MTLVEVMVVVAMVGVLGALAITSYQKYVDWSSVAETKDIINGLSNGQEAYFADAQGYLDCSDDWDSTSIYPRLPNSRKHPFHNPTHPNYDCFRLLQPTVDEPTYMSFWVRADEAGTDFPSNPTDLLEPELTGNGLTRPDKPWYWIVAVGDINEDGNRGCFMATSAAPSEILAQEEN